jgi:hypothetical protein
MNNTPRRPWSANFRRKIHAKVVITKRLMQREGSGHTFIVVESENVLASGGDGLPSGRLRPLQTATG